MPNDLRLERLTRAGIELMREERDLALKGDLAALGELNTRKESFLAQLEELSAQLERGGAQPLQAARKQELATLFDIMRRRAEENQYLLKAAKAGVRAAARRVSGLDAGAGMGAYAPNGDPLASAEAASKKSQVF